MSNVELGDFFTFSFGPAMQELDGAPEGGFRFPIEAVMDGDKSSQLEPWTNR